MQLIDGKTTSATIRAEIALEVQQLKTRGLKLPHLAAILVGNDGGSETYIAAKMKACKEVGFNSTLVRFSDDVTEQELLDAISSLNNNPEIDGFIVQLPLPIHVSEEKVTDAIDPRKDVDGFHPVNIGRAITGAPAFTSATPQGILELIKRYEIETRGKHVVILGRSNIVGRPLSILLSLKGYPGDATVTVCHSKTQNLDKISTQADIIIAALGVPGFLKENMVKEGAVVIDVGTTRVDWPGSKNGWKLKGDVDFDKVAPKCSFITPVPGGVGPMTITSLLQNTLKAAKKEIYP